MPEGREDRAAGHLDATLAELSHPLRAIDAGVPRRRWLHRSNLAAAPKTPAAGGHSQILECPSRRRADPRAEQAGRQRGLEGAPLRSVPSAAPLGSWATQASRACRYIGAACVMQRRRAPSSRSWPLLVPSVAAQRLQRRLHPEAADPWEHSGYAARAIEGAGANGSHPVADLRKARLGEQKPQERSTTGCSVSSSPLVARCCSPCPGPPEPFCAGRGNGPAASDSTGHARYTPGSQHPLTRAQRGSSGPGDISHYGKLGLSKLVALCCSLVPGPFEPYRAGSGNEVARFKPRLPQAFQGHQPPRRLRGVPTSTGGGFAGATSRDKPSNVASHRATLGRCRRQLVGGFAGATPVTRPPSHVPLRPPRQSAPAVRTCPCCFGPGIRSAPCLGTGCSFRPGSTTAAGAPSPAARAFKTAFKICV